MEMSRIAALDPPRATRPRYRPPIGLPLQRASRWGTPVSVLVHVAVLLLLLAPFATRTEFPIIAGAGGPGPAGGGGGGHEGRGGSPAVTEALRFVRVAPPRPAETRPSVVAPPVEQPEPPKPEPRVAEQIVAPRVAIPKVDLDVKAPATPIASITPGMGGGTGTDGSAGNGPGTGGGAGTGTGTGRGPGTGPGTGGGEGVIYPPKAEFTPVIFKHPRMDADSVVIWFTLDDRGNVLRVDVNSGNHDFDRELREQYSQARFKPATKSDGTPVPGRFPITLRF